MILIHIMRYIKFIILFLALNVYSQDKQIISIGVDAKLLINGAYSYDDTPVLDGYFNWITQKDNGVEVGLFVEYANLNPNFFAMGFSGGYNFNLVRRFDTVLNLEGGLIVRSFENYDTQKVFLFMGVNGIVRFWIVDFISLDLRLNVKYRNDLAKHYNDSNPIRISGITGLSFKF